MGQNKGESATTWISVKPDRPNDIQLKKQLKKYGSKIEKKVTDRKYSYINLSNLLAFTTLMSMQMRLGLINQVLTNLRKLSTCQIKVWDRYNKLFHTNYYLFTLFQFSKLQISANLLFVSISMSKNVHFKIANAIAAMALAVIVMSITSAITAPGTQLFAKKHKDSNSGSGSDSSDNHQTSSNDKSVASGGVSESGNEVKIVGIKHSNSFSPNPVDVRVGDTVTWTNDHHVGHTVTSTSSEFNSGDIQPGQSYRHTFDKPGTFEYYCIIHPSMVGKVSVG